METFGRLMLESDFMVEVVEEKGSHHSSLSKSQASRLSSSSNLGSSNRNSVIMNIASSDKHRRRLFL